MRKIWAEYEQEVLIVSVSLVLLLDVLAFGLGYGFAVKALPVLITLIAALILFVWQTQPLSKVKIACAVIIGSYLITLIATKADALLAGISYGNILGLKILGVPFVMGILWLLISISSWHIVNFGNLSTVKKYILGIFIILMFDLILEQSAAALSLWSWQHGQILLSNYFIWSLIALLTFLIIDRISRKFKPSLFIASLLPVLSIYFWLMLFIS
jgi:putative membrane protein